MVVGGGSGKGCGLDANGGVVSGICTRDIQYIETGDSIMILQKYTLFPDCWQ